MPHNNNPAEEASESGGSVRRFRLPKLFADSAEDTLPQHLLDSAAQQNAADTAPATTAREYSQLPQQAPPPPLPQHIDAMPQAGKAAADDAAIPALPPRRNKRNSDAAARSGGSSEIDTESNSAEGVATKLAAQSASTAAASAPGAAYASVLLKEIEEMRGEIETMSLAVTDLRDSSTAQDKVFDTLHAELQDYKNDFIYEHLKPVVRPLLFLYDSLEQFDGEMAEQERAQIEERREFSPAMVRENVTFFRSQLVESLRICEVIPMEEPEGFFDPKLHKAVDVIPVGPELHRVVLRQVRSGWFLNGRVFRTAEVIVGRCETEVGDADNGESENADADWQKNTAENNNATS